MARIRSVHPGFFSDEAIVTLSFPARLLLIGLLTECDDGGAFEWKPITIKMRLFPADNVDVASLLEELGQAGTIRKEEIDGHKLGLVRNFARFQRPKKPKYRFTIPPKFRTYVGLTADGSEPDSSQVTGVPHQFRTDVGLNPSGGEISPQKEDEEEKEDKKEAKKEGKKEEERKKDKNAPICALSSTSSTKGRDEDAPSGALLSNSSTNGRNGGYAFEAGTVKLVAKDLEQWRKSFPNLSLESELTGLAQWAGSQPNWFHAVSGALAKRQREAVLALERIRLETAAKGEMTRPPKPLWNPGL